MQITPNTHRCRGLSHVPSGLQRLGMGSASGMQIDIMQDEPSGQGGRPGPQLPGIGSGRSSGIQKPKRQS